MCRRIDCIIKYCTSMFSWILLDSWGRGSDMRLEDALVFRRRIIRERVEMSWIGSFFLACKKGHVVLWDKGEEIQNGGRAHQVKSCLVLKNRTFSLSYCFRRLFLLKLARQTVEVFHLKILLYVPAFSCVL